MQEIKKRAAIYIRVSSDEAKKEGYSPETQEEKLREFVIANNYELNEKYVYNVDLGCSGSTDKRPGLQKLLKDAKNKEFDIILVYRQDRFFRNLRLLLNTVADLRELGIEFKSLTEPFDTTTPTGRAMFANAGVFAEWMREVGLESRDEGMKKAMRDGKWLGGTPPYGYRFNRETQKLERDEEESKIVKMIFEWVVLEKLSKYKVQQRLNERKIPTKWARLKRDKPVNSPEWWNARTVERILKYETYTGTFYYRKYKCLQGMRKELRPREEWITIETPAIISKELFEKAQEQLKTNQMLSPRRTKRIYTFQHKIYCGLDGFPYHSMFRYPAHPHWNGAKVYFCGGKIKHCHEKLCSSKYITESRLLPTVWQNLKDLLANPEIVMENFQEYHDRDSKSKSIEEELERANKVLLDCQRQKKKAFKIHLEGYVDEESYKTEFEELKKKELGYKKEIERLSQFLLSEQEKENRALSVRELYKRLKDSIDNATYEIQCWILQKLVEKIIITGDSLGIEYGLPFKENLQEMWKITPALEFYDDKRRMDRAQKYLGDSCQIKRLAASRQRQANKNSFWRRRYYSRQRLLPPRTY